MELHLLWLNRNTQNVVERLSHSPCLSISPYALQAPPPIPHSPLAAHKSAGDHGDPYLRKSALPLSPLCLSVQCAGVSPGQRGGSMGRNVTNRGLQAGRWQVQWVSGKNKRVSPDQSGSLQDSTGKGLFLVQRSFWLFWYSQHSLPLPLIHPLSPHTQSLVYTQKLSFLSLCSSITWNTMKAVQSAHIALSLSLDLSLSILISVYLYLSHYLYLSPAATSV